MDEWYYAEDDARIGPVSEDTLRELLASGQISDSSLVWRHPMADWQPAASIPELAAPGRGAGPFAPEAALAVPAAVTYAGFWKRFAAFAIDWVITLVLTMPVSFVILITLIAAGAVSDPERSFAIGQGIGSITRVIVNWLYYAFFESSSRQATIGKMALGIRVTNMDGGRISFAHASMRHFAKILSALTFFIGFILAGITAKKQALHDLVAGCLVVNAR